MTDSFVERVGLLREQVQRSVLATSSRMLIYHTVLQCVKNLKVI